MSTGDHDVGPFAQLDLINAPGDIDASPMRGNDIAGNHINDLSIAIQYYIDDEFQENTRLTDEFIKPVFESLKSEFNIPDGLILGKDYKDKLKNVLVSSKTFLIITDIVGIAPREHLYPVIVEKNIQPNRLV